MALDWLTDTRLVLALWLAVGLLALGFGLRRRHAPPSIDRQITIVSAAVGAVLLILGVQAARYAVFQQRAIAGRVGVDPEYEEVVANPRQTSSDLSAPRGAILASDGTRMAWSELSGGVYTRFYGDAALAPVTGFYSPLLYGKAGLESTWDDALTGAGGRSLLDRLAGSVGLSDTGPLDLVLTIQPELQREAAQLLSGNIGAAIVVDPQTGAILAMASAPSVDPVPLAAVNRSQVEAARNAWERLLEDPETPLVRRATEGLYPPGSTFKVVTAAAGIESGIVEPDSVFEDNGSIDIDGHVIVEANRPDESVTQFTLTEGFAYSLNVVFAQVGLQIGRLELENRARAFGIGAAIPFDEFVSGGQMASDDEFLDAPAALADTSFGQGELLVTPLHMAMVASAVANDGALMQPYLVNELRDQSGRNVADDGTADFSTGGRSADGAHRPGVDGGCSRMGVCVGCASARVIALVARRERPKVAARSPTDGSSDSPVKTSPRVAVGSRIGAWWRGRRLPGANWRATAGERACETLPA